MGLARNETSFVRNLTPIVGEWLISNSVPQLSQRPF